MSAFIAYPRRLRQTFVEFDGSTPLGVFTRLEAGSFGVWNALRRQWFDVQVGDYLNVTDYSDVRVVPASRFTERYERDLLIVSGGRGYIVDVSGQEVVGP